MHVQTKVVMEKDDLKFTLHIYNSTQRINVAGKGSIEFVEQVLKPYFSSQIDVMKNEISEYDKGVIKALSNKSVKRSNIKFKAAPILGSLFSCNKCDFASKTKVQLTKHKHNIHSKGFSKSTDSSRSRILGTNTGPKHSKMR